GSTGEPWIGPDVQDLTRDLHEEKGYTTFVYAPVGFVSDHLEVLYDNDYECKVVCDEIGAGYYRPNMPNSHPLFIQTLADVVLKEMARDNDEARANNCYRWSWNNRINIGLLFTTNN